MPDGRIRYGCSKRTSLALNPEMKSIVKLMAAFGPLGFETMVALSRSGSDVAETCSLLSKHKSSICKVCMKKGPAKCPKMRVKPQALRARVRRLEQRIKLMQSGEFFRAARQAVFADEGVDGGPYEYAEDSAIYEEVRGDLHPVSPDWRQIWVKEPASRGAVQQ